MVRRFGSSTKALAGPSGPNSVQKTRLEAGFRSYRRGDVLRFQILIWSQCQCSTHERYRRTCVFEIATKFTSPVYRGIFECSLERR